MSPSRSVRVLAAFTLTLTPVLAAAGQSSVTVSPFVSYVPSAATNPLAGFALTFGGTTGLALRSGAEMSISNPRIDSAVAQAGGYRPWAVDADAMLFLGGIGGGATMFRRALAPYVFAGLGLSGGDSAGINVTRHGWSYGAGATMPLGMHADLFAEARWRMPQYVLPTSDGAPDSKSAMRFGLSFHVGGGSTAGRGSRRPRHHVDAAQDDAGYVVAPAAPQPVVVVSPSAPPPEVVIVEQQSEPETIVIEREAPPVPTTTTVITNPQARRYPTTTVTTARRPVLRAPGRVRSSARTEVRGSNRTIVRPTPSVRGGIPPRAQGGVQPRVQGGVQRRTGPVAAGAASKSAPTARARVQARKGRTKTDPATKPSTSTKQSTITKSRRTPK